MKLAAIITMLAIHIHSSQCGFAQVSKVDCWPRNGGGFTRPGNGWDNLQWPKGVTTITQDAPPAKKVLKVADVILSQKAVQNPNQHVALLCEVRAPWVDINAIFMKQEGNPAYQGEMGTIASETNSFKRRFFLRGLVNGHGYKVRLQFFGSYSSAAGSQAKATPATMNCGVVYPLFPNEGSKGCEFIQIMQ